MTSNCDFPPLRIVILNWLFRGTDLEEVLNKLIRRVDEMAASLDDLITMAGDIKDNLSQFHEKLDLIEKRLGDIVVGEPVDQAKIDAVYDALSEVKTLASQALSQADSLDGEEG